ncbi:MAG: serine hydrolase [Alphaproteobacteria bacterium]
MFRPETVALVGKAINMGRIKTEMTKSPTCNPKRQYHWRKWLATLAVCVVILCGVALSFAPYLPRLLAEGFPAAHWPANGHYAEIIGVPKPTKFKSAGLKPNPWAKQLFDTYGSKALLVFHKGQLKLEYYASDVSSQTKFNSYSMAKSLVGVLVLKAHAEGLLKSLDDPIGRYLPTLATEAVRNRPIRSFLDMRSGLSFEASSKTLAPGMPPKEKKIVQYNPFSRLAQLHMCGFESVQKGLRLNTDEIGQYKYQNINTAVLAHLLVALYHRPLETLLSEKIWRPAGADTAFWRRYDADKPVSPYCCIFATARDWLRIGRFLTNNGTDGKPFLPLNTWRSFMGGNLKKTQLKTNYYGYHVFHNILNRKGEPLQGRFTFMLGTGGQVIYLMPERDLVVVRMGERTSLLHSTLYSAWRSISLQ